ncbi:WD repeat-containing protein 87 [Hydra vulgaris]|uniref:WD repeat-containing protein 87 n=1 Tax=Hydra vulgaris TaxID=6087 RepID=UPI000640E41E|nr:WD repeat-containing protein 87 [Hydra vulgaris]
MKGRLHRPQGSNFRKALVEQTKQRSKLAPAEESSSRENSKLELEKKNPSWPTHIDKLILDGQKHSNKRTCQSKNLEKTDQDQQALHEEQDNTVQSINLIQNRKSTPCRQTLSSQELTTNKYEKILQVWKIEKPVQSRSLLCEEQKSTIHSVKSIQENCVQSAQIDKCLAENEYSQLKSTIKPAIDSTTKPAINSITSKSKLIEDAKIVMHSKRKMSESYKAAPIISNEQRRYTQPALEFKTSSIRKKSLSEQCNQPIIEKPVTTNKVESDESPNNTAQRRLSKTELAKRERKISLQESQSIKNQVLNLEPEKFSQLFSYAQRRISDASPQMPGYPICDPKSSLLCESKIIEEQPSSLTESEFQKQAVMTLCEYCNYCILTKLEYHAGFHTCVWSGIICIATGFLCGFIPFCINECKDVVHKCPNCNKVLGTYRRL